MILVFALVREYSSELVIDYDSVFSGKILLAETESI